MRATLTIIGCGHVGKALARLWTSHQTFLPQDILNRSIESSQRAVAFIGAGRALSDYADLRAADVYLIAAPDDQIVQCCDQLARTGLLSADSIVFHCSGAMRSSELLPAIECGASVASVHPIRSFAAPEQVVQSFAGTYCGIEGDQRAVDVLSEGFSAIGAKLVAVNADHKVLYHSAAVFASNYLTTLIDVAVQAYGKAGISGDVALEMLEPLVRKTVDNVFRIGPTQALSGPIARGDMATVEKQQRAVAAWNPQYADLYRQFATLTAELAARRNAPDV